jgi:hypothetical protein
MAVFHKEKLEQIMNKVTPQQGDVKNDAEEPG